MALAADTVAAEVGPRPPPGFTAAAINDMQKFFHPESTEYRKNWMHDLETCITKWNDPDLLKASDSSWKGFTDYYANQEKNDPWPDCITNPDAPSCLDDRWIEGHNRHYTFFGNGTDRQMLIMEPCNYVSNVAYYHTVMRTCEYPEWNYPASYTKAFKRSFVTLASGSAFMHGSHTALGWGYDNYMIGVISYTAYRGIVEKLGATTRAVLSLQNDYDALDGMTLSERFAFFSYNTPVDTWRYQVSLLASQFPADYFYSFAGLVFIMMYLCLPTSVATWALRNVMSILNLPEEVQTFFNEEYGPQIIPLVAKTNVSLPQSIDLFISFVGMLIKVGWAFMWQEQYSPGFVKGLYTHLGLTFARAITPELNSIASYLDGIYSTDADTVFGTELYPGARYCNTQSPHSLWHQQSADCFFDLIMIFDKLYGLI